MTKTEKKIEELFDKAIFSPVSKEKWGGHPIRRSRKGISMDKKGTIPKK